MPSDDIFSVDCRLSVWLRARREDCGVTVREIGEATGRGETRFSEVQRGAWVPDASYLRALQDVLSLSDAELRAAIVHAEAAHAPVHGAGAASSEYGLRLMAARVWDAVQVEHLGEAPDPLDRDGVAYAHQQAEEDLVRIGRGDPTRTRLASCVQATHRHAVERLVDLVPVLMRAVCATSSPGGTDVRIGFELFPRTPALDIEASVRPDVQIHLYDNSVRFLLDFARDVFRHDPLSDSELASQIGIDRKTLWRSKRSRRIPSARSRALVSRWLAELADWDERHKQLFDRMAERDASRGSKAERLDREVQRMKAALFARRSREHNADYLGDMHAVLLREVAACRPISGQDPDLGSMLRPKVDGAVLRRTVRKLAAAGLLDPTGTGHWRASAEPVIYEHERAAELARLRFHRMALAATRGALQEAPHGRLPRVLAYTTAQVADGVRCPSFREVFDKVFERSVHALGPSSGSPDRVYQLNFRATPCAQIRPAVAH